VLLQIGFEHQPSHALWNHALTTWAATAPAAPDAALAAPELHQVPLPPNALWQVRTGSADPQKEDRNVFTANALAYIDAWEGGRRGGLWIRPACDGMTISLPGAGEGARDDVY